MFEHDFLLNYYLIHQAVKASICNRGWSFPSLRLGWMWLPHGVGSGPDELGRLALNDILDFFFVCHTLVENFRLFFFITSLGRRFTVERRIVIKIVTKGKTRTVNQTILFRLIHEFVSLNCCTLIPVLCLFPAVLTATNRGTELLFDLGTGQKSIILSKSRL